MNQSTPAAQQSDYRIEHDTMGEVRVPVSALYRACLLYTSPSPRD